MAHVYFEELTGAAVRGRLGVPEQYTVDALLGFGIFDRSAATIVRDVERHAGLIGRPITVAPVGAVEYSHATEVTGASPASPGGRFRIWVVPVMGTAVMAYYAHAACALGARALVLGGSAGGLQEGMATGDFIVPSAVVGNDSAALYARHAPSTSPTWSPTALGPRLLPDTGLAQLLAAGLRRGSDGGQVWTGETVTCEMLGAETADDVRSWAEQGFIGVEMETAVVFAVGAAFGVPAAAAQYVADCLVDGHHFFHSTYADSHQARRCARRAVVGTAFDAVLEVLG